MINPYRPIPSLPPPPPPGPLMAPPAALPAQQPAQPPWPQPVQAQRLNWDPLGELAFSIVGTPIAALVGAGIGYLVAGPLGAARGALLGAATPGSVFVAYELVMNNPWWGTPPHRTGGLAIAALAGFPLLSAAGYGIGLAAAGAAGAAWGTLIAAALPVAVVIGGGAIARWLRPPVYDPNPVPAPTVPPTR